MATKKPYGELTRTGKWKRVKKQLKGQQSYSCASISSEQVCVSNSVLMQDEVIEEEILPGDNSLISVQREESNLKIWNMLKENPLSDSDSEDDFTEIDEKEVIKTKLRDWALEFNTTNASLSKLLCILKTHSCFNSFPVDARTVLKTPRTVDVVSVNPGQYCHLDFSLGVKKMLSNSFDHVTSIELLIGIDGVPLFDSSSGELWPILGSIVNLSEEEAKVFPIGVYYGSKKPADCTSFLSAFTNDAISLIEDGITLDDGRNIPVRIKGICCDAPAKSFILGVKHHNGYFSCTRCKQEGSFFNSRMTFPLFNCAPRSHEGFLAKEDEEFHKNDTPLSAIPHLNMVYSIPLDYMHLVCLGVMRTMLYIWIFGAPPNKLPSKIVELISSNLVQLQGFIPSEFCRRPRGLDQIKRWKATELRQFLLYTAPIVLRDALLPDHEDFFDNFMTLHISMRILLSKNYCIEHKASAKSLLLHFVQNFKTLYGQQYITHNFHGLLHIADDVDTFGPLDNCSAFRFENFLQSLKKLVRKGEKPLQQVVKRLNELSASNYDCNNRSNRKHVCNATPIYLRQHFSGPVTETCDRAKQYKVALIKSFKFTTSLRDSCCMLTDGSIVLIDNFVYSDTFQSMAIICRSFKTVSDFFGDPLPNSSDLNIFRVNDLCKDISIRKISEISEKMVLLKLKDKCLVLPLLHSDFF